MGLADQMQAIEEHARSARIRPIDHRSERAHDWIVAA
jgi:hypothetical protein